MSHGTRDRPGRTHRLLKSCPGLNSLRRHSPADTTEGLLVPRPRPRARPPARTEEHANFTDWPSRLLSAGRARPRGWVSLNAARWLRGAYLDDEAVALVAPCAHVTNARVDHLSRQARRRAHKGVSIRWGRGAQRSRALVVILTGKCEWRKQQWNETPKLTEYALTIKL